MTTHIPATRAALLACATLACGPKSPESDTAATDTATGSTSAPSTDAVTTGGSSPLGACVQVPDPGPCDGALDRYFFNQESHRCEVFAWGGCGGVVPFTDFVLCQNTCDSCGAFFNKGTSQFSPVEIEIRNDTAAPIFLRTFVYDSVAFREEIFAVWPDGASEPVSIEPNNCDFPCGYDPGYDCQVYCTDAGPPPPPIMIIPGGVLHTQWGGQYMGQAQIPARCEPDCPENSCGRWLDATPGPHEIRVAAATSWSCDGPDCCSPNADGWCELPGPNEYYADPYSLELVVPFTFPEGPVLLAFQ